MTTYISLLRGINVSGQKLIKMDTLKKVYEELGYKDVHTHLQSGNVIFSSQEKDIKRIEAALSSGIRETFGFHVPILVLTHQSLKEIIHSNPFIKSQAGDISFLHVTFLAAPPAHIDEEAIRIKKQTEEEIEITSRAVYLYCPDGYGKTKLNNSFLEKKLNVSATTRNWKTTQQLLKLAAKQYEL